MAQTYSFSNVDISYIFRILFPQGIQNTNICNSKLISYHNWIPCESMEREKNMTTRIESIRSFSAWNFNHIEFYSLLLAYRRL